MPPSNQIAARLEGPLFVAWVGAHRGVCHQAVFQRMRRASSAVTCDERESHRTTGGRLLLEVYRRLSR